MNLDLEIGRKNNHELKCNNHEFSYADTIISYICSLYATNPTPSILNFGNNLIHKIHGLNSQSYNSPLDTSFDESDEARKKDKQIYCFSCGFLVGLICGFSVLGWLVIDDWFEFENYLISINLTTDDITNITYKHYFVFLRKNTSYYEFAPKSYCSTFLDP